MKYVSLVSHCTDEETEAESIWVTYAQGLIASKWRYGWILINLSVHSGISDDPGLATQVADMSFSGSTSPLG